MSSPRILSSILTACALLLIPAAVRAGVDSVVTFNELHYNPAADQASGEWIELRNQNSTDIDLSGWRLDGGVDFTFPRGTVIRGGKYLVVAADPAALSAATGLTGVTGPFTSQLSNSGETITLKNHNDRRMDEISFNDREPWPVAADGSGASLAKTDEMHDSGSPGNWRASTLRGGTPGALNFTEAAAAGRPLVINEVTAADASAFWVELLNYGTAPVSLEGYVLGLSTGASFTLPTTTLAAGSYLVINEATAGFRPADSDRVFLYGAGKSEVIDGVVVKAQKHQVRRRGIAGGRPGEFLATLNDAEQTPGALGAVALSDAVVINEIMYHRRPAAYVGPAVPPVYATEPVVARGSVWRHSKGAAISGWPTAAFDDTAWASGPDVLGYELSVIPEAIRTNIGPLDNTTATYYFRHSFSYSPAAGVTHQLRLLIDDGCVVWLNGTAIGRYNMPDGNVTSSTPALANIEASNYTFIDVPEGALLAGNNVLAVEVHQYAPTSSDVVFGCELMKRIQTAPGTPAATHQESPAEWIELYNRSASPVMLDGWTIDDAVSFTFPAGSLLPPGAYLIVANDRAAFAAANPGIPVTGNFDGGLSNRGERILLRDSLGNAVDEVFYRDKAPWPIFTDGLGSSLELKNPDTDNSVPESWADSDESLRSVWKNYTFTAAAATPIYSPVISPSASATTSFHELRMGLLEEGEVLVDDVSVREITTAPNVELMQNGTFSSGNTAAWRILGNHETSGIFNDGGNNTLRIAASGPLLYMHNLLETSLKSGAALVPVVSGRQYRISFRAKWLRGCPWLHTEIYYNKVARTFLLEQPAASGTPGAQNSVYAANPGPAFTGVRHSPAVPVVSQIITVSARVTDPQGVGAVVLRYSVNGAASFASASMTAAADGIYTATIPGQASGAVIQFYIQAADNAVVPVTAMWPAAGPGSRALIKVNDGAALSGRQNLRVITTAADAALMANPVHTMSNRRRGCTIVHNEREVFYDGAVRLRGSMFSRTSPGTSGISVTFPADHLFRGTQRTISVRRSGMSEIVVKHAINSAGRLPDNYNDIVHLISFRSDGRGNARMEMERFNNSWLDEFFPEGSDGTQFKLEGIRVPTQTFANGSIPAGSPEGIKNLTLAGIGWVHELDLADLGPDGEQYRHAFRWLNNFSRNDNARFVAFCRAMSLPVTTPAQALVFEQTIEPLMEVDQWMRTFAMLSLLGVADVYGSNGGSGTSAPHNLNFYQAPGPDGKISVIPWDWNIPFYLSSSVPLTGDKNVQKVIARPRFKRLFLGHLKNLIDTTVNPAYMNPWLSHFSSLTGESYTGFASNITNRNNFVLSQINQQIPPVAFRITTGNGADFSVAGASAVLEGDGWVDVAGIRLNGSPESLDVMWTDENSWRLSVPLNTGINNIVLTAFNAAGVQVGTDSLVITNSSVTEQAAASNTVISEVHYHPSGPESEFIEIMNISPVNHVDLSGCRFSAGIDYVFPPATVINPGTRFVINAAQFLNDTALNNAGERLTLEAPGGVVIRSFTYDDATPWPEAADGTGPSMVLVAPHLAPDHSLPSSWRASTAPGGNPGTTDALAFTGEAEADSNGNGVPDLVDYALGLNAQIVPVLSPQGFSITVPRAAGRDDAVISGEVSTGLSGWIAAEPAEASAASLTFRVPAALAGGKRLFIRAVVRLR